MNLKLQIWVDVYATVEVNQYSLVVNHSKILNFNIRHTNVVAVFISEQSDFELRIWLNTNVFGFGCHVIACVFDSYNISMPPVVIVEIFTADIYHTYYYLLRLISPSMSDKSSMCMRVFSSTFMLQEWSVSLERFWNSNLLHHCTIITLFGVWAMNRQEEVYN